MLIGVALLAIVLGAAAWQYHAEQANAAATASTVLEERLDAIASAWGAANVHMAHREDCPTVRELDRLLPALRGVQRAERDYASLVVGGDC